MSSHTHSNKFDVSLYSKSYITLNFKQIIICSAIITAHVNVSALYTAAAAGGITLRYNSVTLRDERYNTSTITFTVVLNAGRNQLQSVIELHLMF